MYKYILVAESGADVPADIAKKYGIRIVPMHVAMGDVVLNDRTFTPKKIYDYYDKTGKVPQTSGSTPHDFEILFDKIREEIPNSYIVHLAYSSATTCSYQSAVIAAKGRDYVTSIDTKHVTAGQTLFILSIARYIEANPECRPKDIVAKAEELAERVRMAFIPGDLVYLKAGGRVSNAAYLGAKILSLNPLIEIREGKLDATKKYRGSMKKIVPKMINEYIDKEKLRADEPVAFVYTMGIDPNICVSAEKIVRDRGFKEIIWVPANGVISTHSGPGGFGISGIA